MIKLFDFKFLILLTLAVVIYFMYKDMDEQRDRIQKLEDAYRAQLHNQNPESPKQQQVVSQPLPQPLPLPQKQLVPQPLPKQQLVQQSLPKQQPLPKQQIELNNLKLELPNKMAVKKEFIAPELPVYLEKDKETDLEEKNNLEELSVSESEIESETESESEEEESSSTYISKKSKKSVLEIYSNDNLEETLIENKLNVNASEELEDVLNNLEIEINNDILPVNKSKYDSSNLTKLKVSELQELAKNEDISLDKKVNGSNKKKTKQELIDELITK
jgi:hypothetical protein